MHFRCNEAYPLYTYKVFVFVFVSRQKRAVVTVWDFHCSLHKIPHLAQLAAYSLVYGGMNMFVCGCVFHAYISRSVFLWWTSVFFVGANWHWKKAMNFRGSHVGTLTLDFHATYTHIHPYFMHIAHKVQRLFFWNRDGAPLLAKILCSDANAWPRLPSPMPQY